MRRRPLSGMLCRCRGSGAASASQLYEAVNSQLEAAGQVTSRLRALWVATGQQDSFPEPAEGAGSPMRLLGYHTPQSTTSSRCAAALVIRVPAWSTLDL